MIGRPGAGSHPVRPARGELVSAMNPGRAAFWEVWAHPDDTPELLRGIVVNGIPATVTVVDRHAYADQLRIQAA